MTSVRCLIVVLLILQWAGVAVAGPAASVMPVAGAAGEISGPPSRDGSFVAPDRVHIQAGAKSSSLANPDKSSTGSGTDGLVVPSKSTLEQIAVQVIRRLPDHRTLKRQAGLFRKPRGPPTPV
jgi:hypothetical protein